VHAPPQQASPGRTALVVNASFLGTDSVPALLLVQQGGRVEQC
jgi:hypothetical protein